MKKILVPFDFSKPAINAPVMANKTLAYYHGGQKCEEHCEFKIPSIHCASCIWLLETL
jgi:hypothetical protein